MPTQVIAEAGDCLCVIAISSGFIDCQPLRTDPANSGLLARPLVAGDVVTVPDVDTGSAGAATDQRHVFVRRNAPPVNIRFVHGSKNVPYLKDAESLILHISNHQTTRGGAEDEAVLPNAFGFNPLGHDDPDTFKVEVVDPQAASPVNVQLEALRRVVRPDGSFGHDPFPGAEKARRSLDPLECRIVSSGVAFRSRYLRLVTDDTDKAALPNQTLLVTDMTDEGDATVEILEQAVRATYKLQKCPARACEVSKTVLVGSTAEPRKPTAFLRVAVHILTPAPGSAPVVTIAQADRRITRWVRRIYAQAGLTPRFAQATRVVEPQNNLVAIGEPQGLTAAGGGQMRFRITSPGQPTQVIGPFATVAGSTPAVTAAALAALVAPPYTATVTVNPPGFSSPLGNRSADILVTLPGAIVTIDDELTTDARQPLAVGRPNPVSLQGFSNDFLIGSIQQRTLLKNFDTGDDRVDVFVIQAFATPPTGQAMMHGVSIDPLRPAIAPVRFSVFVRADTMDGTDNNFKTISHEMGHVLIDVIHAIGTRSNQQLMRAGGQLVVAEDGPKRIKERPQQFDSPAGSHRQLERIRRFAAGLLE